MTDQVDISKIAVGDAIAVSYTGEVLEVDHDDKRRPLRVTDGGDSDEWPLAAHIVSHTPKALAVGDKVREKGSLATVLFADADDIVIRYDIERGIHSGRTATFGATLVRAS